ncbi:hypothetical protein EON64_18650 [archaeon]|nr:MAG: hypothetical protein EON64_18650 [archaeon]
MESNLQHNSRIHFYRSHSMTNYRSVHRSLARKSQRTSKRSRSSLFLSTFESFSSQSNSLKQRCHTEASGDVMSSSDRRCEELPLEWWERSEGCREAKLRHTERIDRLCSSREDLVLETTLYGKETALEPNMFPCK